MTTTTTTRIFNFAAGPAIMPVPVLEEAQKNLLALPGVGMSVMEISHRSKAFEDTQWKTLPNAGDAPLISDVSSDIFSRPIDVARHGVIYAGAQKNLGPSGVTLVIIREDLLSRSQDTLPTMLNYKVHSDSNSL